MVVTLFVIIIEYTSVFARSSLVSRMTAQNTLQSIQLVRQINTLVEILINPFGEWNQVLGIWFYTTCLESSQVN